jgi:aminobenzoyl-glutamate utilization protein B
MQAREARRLALVLLAGAAAAPPLAAQAPEAEILASLDASREDYAGIARQIWTLAEVGYQEHRSSALLQSELGAAGFRVEDGVAGMPTAFVASYGSGDPVIAILAEYDALPGISQDAVPERQPRPDVHAGHACGHHLFGTASTAAAIAVKDWLEGTGSSGTIRLYGTPAEEGGSGKVYMVRAGLFDDVDAVLHWHPGSVNEANPEISLANISGKFRFRGVSAHAAAAPERGRSALDAAEAMNHMVNLLREHVPDFTRIHYVITRGGEAPNVVPDATEVYYYARHPDPEVVKDVWARIVKAAEGAAVGTGTEVEHEITGGVYSLLPNNPLGQVVHRNLERVGGVRYSDADRAFAETIRASFPQPRGELADAAAVVPFRAYQEGQPRSGAASTDVGDVSWAVPTAGFNTATWVPGTAAHSWQAVAAGGTDIGTSGMMVAAKTLALSAVELFQNPSLLAEARAELEARRGSDFQYRPLVGDRDPPLDYRR